MGQRTDCKTTLRLVAAENIANIEHKLMFETDPSRRKLLQGILVLEREKLKT